MSRREVRMVRIVERVLVLSMSAFIAVGSVVASVAVSIDVRARGVTPGEPLRVVVRAGEPLERLGGEFLGRAVFMTRIDQPGGEESWVGWTMIALDEEPATHAFEVSGTTRGGDSVVGTRAIRVEAKQFPEERLEVASKYVKPPKEVEERLAAEREKLAAIYRARRPAFSDEPFVRPVGGEPTSIFGLRRIYNGEPRSPHPGLDLRAPTGTPVLASGDGEVVLAQDLYYSGNTVILDHGGGLFTIYAHLSKIEVKEGRESRAGETLGLSGATGRVTGPHLHWGAKIGNRPFDPTALLDASLFEE